MRRALILLCLCALVVEPLAAQDAAGSIKAAQYALGMIRGPQRIDAINTIEYWATANGGAYTYHASISYLTPAMRLDITRGKDERVVGAVSGKYAWDESVPGAGFIPGTTATPMPQEAVKNRLLDLWSTPHGSLKAAVAAGAAAKLTTENGTSVITFPLSGLLAGITMKVTLNSKDQVEKVETRMGNDTAETTYSDYKDLGEIKSDVLLPAHIVQKKGNRTLDLTITKADMNNPYVVFPVPDNVEKAQRD